MQIFFHLFQLTAVQAFLRHRELHYDSKMKQHDFFLKLIDGLIGGRTVVLVIAEYAKDVFIIRVFLELGKSQRVDLVWDVYMQDSLKLTFNDGEQRDRNTQANV